MVNCGVWTDSFQVLRICHFLEKILRKFFRPGLPKTKQLLTVQEKVKRHFFAPLSALDLNLKNRMLA